MDAPNLKYSLSRLIIETLGIEHRSAQYYDVFAVSLRYVAWVDTSYEYQRKLKQLVDFSELGISAQGFRLKLIGSNLCSLNLRYFLHNVGRMRSIDSKSVREFAVAFRLAKSDARAAYQLFKNNSEFRTAFKRSPAIRKAPADRITPEAFQSLDSLFREIYTPLIRYVKHISFSKLRFISTSTNTDLSDLHGDLMLRAVQAFHMLMPGDYEPLYISNYIKRAIHNHAINMIHAATAEKRSRLVVGSEDGFNETFILRCASENQLNVGREDGEQIGYDELMSEEFVANDINRRDTEMAVAQMLARYQNKPKKFQFLKLLMGQYDKEFTEFLRVNRRLRSVNHDNVDYQESASNARFIGQVCGYLSIDESKAHSFLHRVGARHFPGGIH